MKKSFLLLMAFISLYMVIPTVTAGSAISSNRKPQATQRFREHEYHNSLSQLGQNQEGILVLKPTVVNVPGLTLAFHREPDKEETAIILKKATEEGLKKIKAFSSFKQWVFEWEKPKHFLIAVATCVNFPKTSSLKYCVPNYPLDPAESVSLEPSFSIHPNRFSCDISPDHNTYWAQNMIGVDLLREELKKKDQKIKTMLPYLITS